MNSKEFSRSNKAIHQLIEIEQEFEELRNSKRLISLRDSKKPESFDEANRIKFHELSATDKHILQLHGRNLPIDEIEKILESEPWSNGFQAATNNLIQKYDFFKKSGTNDGRLYTPTEDTVKAFKASGVISQREITNIIEGLKIRDPMAQAKASLVSVYSILKDKNKTRATLKNTTNNSSAANNVPGQSRKPDYKRAGAVSGIRRNISRTKKMNMDEFLELDAVEDMSMDSEELHTILTADFEEEDDEYISLIESPIQSHKFKLNDGTKRSNVFPSCLCKRTNVFMFPPLPVGTDSNPSTDAEDLYQYKNTCLNLARSTSVNAVGFCKKAKVACAMLISIFEEIFCLFQHSQVSSFVENRYGKILMQQIFSELYALECEIVDQKRRCIKFLIDANIFLTHDPPLSQDDGSWSDQQKYMWQLANIRYKLCIKQLEVLINKLKEAQTEFIAQYKAFLAFCKLSLK